MIRQRVFQLSLWAFMLLALPAQLLAQDSVTLDRFSASETPEDDFHLSRPSALGHLRFGAMLHVDYANDPLVWELRNGDSSSESHRVVSDHLNLNLGLSLGLWDRVVVFAGLPFTAWMDGDDEAALTAAGITTQADGAGLGDLSLGARVRLLGEADDVFVLGLQLTGTFPTAGDQTFRGESFLSLHPELLLQVGTETSVRFVLNVGGKIRQNSAPAANLPYADDLTFGAGFAVPLWRSSSSYSSLSAYAQVYGATAFNDFFARNVTALEAIAGVKFAHTSGFTVGLAGGPGLSRGFGTPDYRLVGMVGFALPGERSASGTPGDQDGDGILDETDACPADPEDVDQFEDADGCPELDNDQDGLNDSNDQCPLEPEDRDEFQDADGCLDADDDSDGIIDTEDECRLEPEDIDQWQDENGCPELDNDSDGIVDGSDRCPNESGPVANGGCPDTDRDGDTVVDRLDNCPDEPGTVANQGCRRRQQVRIEAGRLEILDVVYFKTNRDVIERRSFGLLRNVAQVLNAHTEIVRIRVEGHTDSRGSRDANVDLSQRRAEAVVRFLVNESVDAGRLEAQGFGPDRPIVPDATSAAQHAQNRRVEFNIVGAEGVEQAHSAADSTTIDR